jgi:hypothetical protein
MDPRDELRARLGRTLHTRKDLAEATESLDATRAIIQWVLRLRLRAGLRAYLNLGMSGVPRKRYMDD